MTAPKIHQASIFDIKNLANNYSTDNDIKGESAFALACRTEQEEYTVEMVPSKCFMYTTNNIAKALYKKQHPKAQLSPGSGGYNVEKLQTDRLRFVVFPYAPAQYKKLIENMPFFHELEDRLGFQNTVVSEQDEQGRFIVESEFEGWCSTCLSFQVWKLFMRFLQRKKYDGLKPLMKDFSNHNHFYGRNPNEVQKLVDYLPTLKTSYKESWTGMRKDTEDWWCCSNTAGICSTFSTNYSGNTLSKEYLLIHEIQKNVLGLK